MTMPLENVAAFQKRFEEIVSKSIKEESLTPEVEIDMEIELSDINPKFYRILKQFAPFGPGNMAPVFLTRNLIDNGTAKIVGATHLKATFGKQNQLFMDAIAFGRADMLLPVSKKIPVDICYTLDENHWNNSMTIQLMVKDIKC
jgi:single-stranded-DNA-specific exonuclease